jgi:hypothetical protein
MRLLAQPGIAFPDSPWNKRIVIAGNDENGAGAGRTFQYRKRPGGNIRTRNAMIVEHVAGDHDEVHPVFGSLLAELLERREAGLADPITSTLLESCDSQTQMEIRSVQESQHVSASV